MSEGQCQVVGCSNTGTLYELESDVFERDEERGVEAGRRWYCKDCVDAVCKMLGDPDTVENLETGEVRAVSKAPSIANPCDWCRVEASTVIWDDDNGDEFHICAKCDAAADDDAAWEARKHLAERYS
jgi:hypothetical protein